VCPTPSTRSWRRTTIYCLYVTDVVVWRRRDTARIFPLKRIVNDRSTVLELSGLCRRFDFKIGSHRRFPSYNIVAGHGYDDVTRRYPSATNVSRGLRTIVAPVWIRWHFCRRGPVDRDELSIPSVRRGQRGVDRKHPRESSPRPGVGTEKRPITLHARVGNRAASTVIGILYARCGRRRCVHAAPLWKSSTIYAKASDFRGAPSTRGGVQTPTRVLLLYVHL